MRFLCKQSNIPGLSDSKIILSSVTSICYNRESPGLRYITKYQPRYMPSQSIFMLRSYLELQYPDVNCEDQAAAVHSLSAALGVNSSIILMMPFGFISKKDGHDLVGWQATKFPLLALGGQIYFPGHEFVNWERSVEDPITKKTTTETGVFDSCVGPYRGNLDGQSYFHDLVDQNPALYTNGDELGAWDNRFLSEKHIGIQWKRGNE